MFGFSAWELAFVLVIILILFGVGKLPDIGSGMGKALKNFKKATADADLDITNEKKSS
jgi:sec-independent protein translocase protein TatA